MSADLDVKSETVIRQLTASVRYVIMIELAQGIRWNYESKKVESSSYDKENRYETVPGAVSHHQ